MSCWSRATRNIVVCFSILLMASCAYAAKLAIVIDDFGYRPHEENKILSMPTAISIAILPNSPYRLQMAEKAHQQGREILIHLPMAPLSKQPLEKDTLQPQMSEAEIQRILDQAVRNVPNARGLNNHMGSAMTSNLPAMRNLMSALKKHPLYFLDSMTISTSQSMPASAGTPVRVLKRHVFLDDSQQEAEIRRQFNRAVALAQKQGYAIAIGHPHPATVRVLQQMLPQLPQEVVLVKPSTLLNEVPRSHTTSRDSHSQPPQKPRFTPGSQCKLPEPTATSPLEPINIVIRAIHQHALTQQILQDIRSFRQSLKILFSTTPEHPIQE